MVPRKKGPREKWSPGKFPSKIVLRQQSARKFKRLFHFYQLIPLHTQKNVWRLHHDPTYVPNCKTLKESREICCWVLGFHRLITSQHSTHTHTTMPDAHPTIFRFWVSRGQIFRGPFFRGPFFSGTIFAGIIFPRTIFPGDHFSGIHINTK